MIVAIAFIGSLIAYAMGSVWVAVGAIVICISLLELRHRFNEDEISKLRDLVTPDVR